MRLHVSKLLSVLFRAWILGWRRMSFWHRLTPIWVWLKLNEERQSFAWKSSVRRLSRTRQRSWKQRIFVSSSFVRNWKLSRTSRLISTQRSRRIQLKPLLSKLERMQPSTRLRIAWVRTRSDWHKFCKYDAAWRFKSL